MSQHTDTSKNTEAWAVSQHTDTSKNTEAWAVSQHTDTSKNTMPILLILYGSLWLILSELDDCNIVTKLDCHKSRSTDCRQSRRQRLGSHHPNSQRAALAACT